jgi:hypothetical protein
MLSENNKVYLAILMIMVATFGAGQFFSSTIKSWVTVRAIAANEQDYLAALRNSNLGCKTLFARIPDVIVVGDSHAYAGWDFNMLQQKLRKSIGACMMGGIYIDSLVELVTKVADFKPQHIILSLSPRMFWDSETKTAQIESHKSVISKLDGSLLKIRDLFIPHSFQGRQSLEMGQRKKHAVGINSLEEYGILEALKASPDHVSIAAWARRLNIAQHQFTNKKVAIEKLCTMVRQSGVTFSVVYIPESPYLESKYDPNMWKEFEKDVQELGSCAKRVITQRSNFYGIGNRHFVNRYLLNSVSYEPFRNGTHITNDDSFDLDHMNQIGAAIFTQKITDKIN